MTPPMTKEREEMIRSICSGTHLSWPGEFMRELLAELDATREELAMIEDSFNRRHHDLDIYIGKLKSENARLKLRDDKKLVERIKALRECLKFYADENEWIDYKAVCEDGTEVDSHFDGDMGAKAIAALIADEKEDANTADSLVLLLLKRERDLLKQENAKLKLDEKNIWDQVRHQAVQAIEARRENFALKREIEILRQYGNKDCTAMADEVLCVERGQKK
jgi:hypothetical protein